MYLGILRFNAMKPLPLLGVTQKYASEVSNSGLQVDGVAGHGQRLAGEEVGTLRREFLETPGKTRNSR